MADRQAAQAGFRIGVDLGGTKIAAAAIDPAGAVAASRRIATPAGDYDATVAAIAGLVAALEDEIGARASVGIGIPGTIVAGTGLVKNANSTWLNRQAAGARCRGGARARGALRERRELLCAVRGDRRRGCRVRHRVRRDSRHRGRRRHRDRRPAAGRRQRDRRRMGAQPAAGARCRRSAGTALLLRAVRLHRDVSVGPRPRRRSSSSRRASRRGRAERAGDRGGRPRRPGPIAAPRSTRYVERLARALASVINLLDPDAIVLGGGLSSLAILYEEVPRRWGRYVFSDTVVTRLLPPLHGDASGVRGAAWLWPPGSAPTVHRRER